MTKVDPKNGYVIKSIFFYETYSNLTTYLFYQTIFNYFNNFQNRFYD